MKNWWPILISALGAACGGKNQVVQVADCSVAYPNTCDGYDDFGACNLAIDKPFSYKPTITGSVRSFELFNTNSSSAFPEGLVLDRNTGEIRGNAKSSSGRNISIGILANCSGGGTASTTVYFIYGTSGAAQLSAP